MMIDIEYWLPVMIAGAVAGASSGLLGVYIIGMRIPFLGVCISHAALAGAVFGSLAGLTGNGLLLPAFAGALLASLGLGVVDPERAHLDTNNVLGFLFSGTMGLAFLGIGLFDIVGRNSGEVRGLLWGSLNFCGWNEMLLMTLVFVVLLIFVNIFGKELSALMFSRSDAEAAGINAGFVWTCFLMLAAGTLTVNFQTVGGLMIYSLVTNPAIAAFQLVGGARRVILLSMILGAVSGLGGFMLSLLTDLPTGALIVLLSSALALAAWTISNRRIARAA